MLKVPTPSHNASENYILKVFKAILGYLSSTKNLDKPPVSCLLHCIYPT